MQAPSGFQATPLPSDAPGRDQACRRASTPAGDGVREECPMTRGWGSTCEPRPEVATLCSEGHFLSGEGHLCPGILMWANSCPWKPPPRSPGCELPLSQEHSQLVCSLVVRAPTQISPLFPKWLYPKLWEINTSSVEREMGPQASTQGLASSTGTLNPRRIPPGAVWGSPGWALCGDAARSLASLLDVCAGLLWLPCSSVPHPFSHQSSYLWGGQGPPPGKDKSHFSFIYHLLFLLESEKRKLVPQSCLTLCNPMDCSPVHRILQAINTGVGCCSLLQEIFPTWDRTQVEPCIAGRFFTIWATREAPMKGLCNPFMTNY